jgi:hypothetical protein
MADVNGAFQKSGCGGSPRAQPFDGSRDVVGLVRHAEDVRLRRPDLSASLKIAAELSIYAYDAYLIAGARQHNEPLLTLIEVWPQAAKRIGVQVLEVT